MLMRSTTWITVLVGLFMFQSLWNVAAAFCIHEKPTQIQQSYHFGHHQNTLCVSDEYQKKDQNEPSQITKSSEISDLDIGEDHHDHLPSMTQLLVQNEHVGIIYQNFQIKVIPKFYWINRYQAPDLLQASPPPEFPPLMVG